MQRNSELLYPQMLIMSEFLGINLATLRKYKKLQQAQMLELTGISRATWSDYERGKTEPDTKTLIKLAELFGVTLDTLLKIDLSQNSDNVHLNKLIDAGKKGQNVHGKVHASVHLNDHNSDSPTLLVVEKRRKEQTVPIIVTVDSRGQENVLFVPVKARAGYLLGFGDPNFIETLSAYRIPGLNHGTFRIFEVEGHSMFNTLHDKDKVICRWDSIQNVKDDRVYVLVTKNDGILVKRLINRHSEGVMICKSDNNYKGEYPAIVLNIDHIQEVWYVTDRWTKQLPSPGEIYKRIIDLEADMILMKDKLLKKG